MKTNPHYFIFEPLTSLARVGSSLSGYLAKLVNGDKIVNLLFHLPYRIEKINFQPKLFEAHDQELVVICGKIEGHIKPNNSRQPYKINCYNPSGYFNLVFFKIFPSQIEKLKIGNEIAVLGRISKNLNDNQITHPQKILPINQIDELPKIEVVYPLSSALSNNFIVAKINQILQKIPTSCEEWISSEIISQHNFPSFYQAIRKIHHPQSDQDLLPQSLHRQRLAFDEFLARQIAMQMAKNREVHQKKFVSIKINLGENFIKNLPFELTNSQKQAIFDIDREIFSSKKMSRLLQGDVGSGKTVIAIFACLQNISQSKQCCILVPTTVLANQHFNYFVKLINDQNINISLLTSATTKKNKSKIINDLKDGKVNILIATHACLENNIIFKNLGIAIIDEQHRFGVLQRLKIVEKGDNTDLLLMSATPIPRSLMLGLYGDMDISIIGEKPKNRQKIETIILSAKKSFELHESIKRAILRNEKIYWICPAIEDNEEQNLISVEKKYQQLQEIFGENQVALLHGKMKDKDKELIMEDFADINSGKKILISTTVIEVGIDVPLATIIIIENAEHFGLAQLHQLRGRVGRSDKKSFCVLLYGEKYGKNSQKRLGILRDSNDGFYIAEQDLQIRGSGEMLGTKQSGFPEFKIADLSVNHQFLNLANELAKTIIAKDPLLNNVNNKKYQFLLKLFNYDECLRIINSG